MNFTCCCCFDDEITVNHIVSCPSGHMSCIDCIKRAMSVCVGEQTIIKCFDQSGCSQHYTENALCRATPDYKLKRAYDNIVALKSIRSSGLEDTYECPFCNNIVLLDSKDVVDIFYCNQCDRHSCTRCKKDKHDGPCNLKRRKEEEETDKFILKCFCNSPLVRADGCNKLTCYNCRTNWCWICKEHLKGSYHSIYEHFNSNGKNLDKKCKLYGERPKNQVFVEILEKDRPKLRKQIENQGYKPITLGEPCVPPPQLPLPPPQLPLPPPQQQPPRQPPPQQQPPQQQPQQPPVSRKKRGRPRVEKRKLPVCKGVYKYNKEPCTKRAKVGNFCGFHNK
jgi:TRIAD3 protein (E3 ubiquitin-protein ligase RNF216)